ncbi:MAG: hypothetical protein COT90_00340 [Candidatus Diapherotrites archaeon CG10_big_fil_rev_8_21_14_0_10_31_34]|nr:MAG: hypothetical protein COT90_00340 [Candidatus Diapherotrites archaeon CG10_big_fil_rev_8_21_14_0_10_31_34]
MKLFTIALKELKLIKTQKISLMLIFFFPIITILAIGIAFGNVNIFTGTGTGFSEVEIGILVPENNDQSQELISSLRQYERKAGEEKGLIKLIQFGSEAALEEAMNKRDIKIGIIVGKINKTDESVDLELIYDNSTLLETQVTLFVTETILNEVSYRKATQILKEMIYNIETIKTTVSQEINTIQNFINQLESTKNTLDNLEYKVNAIDLTSMKSQLNEFDSYYVDAKNTISNTRNEIYQAQSNLSNYKTKIQNERNKLVSYRDQLQSLKTQLTSIRNNANSLGVPAYLINQIISAENQIDSLIYEMSQTINELDQAVIDIDTTQTKLSQTLNDLTKVGSQLDSANKSVQSFKTTINSMESTLNEIKSMVSETKASRESILSDLKKTKNQMQELSAKLDNLSSVSPDAIVRPLKITKEPLYASTEVSVITPMAIAIVLLLTALLLTSISTILERNQGAELRAKLSPTMNLTWILGKILGQIVFALFETALILIVAFIGFGVVPLGNLFELFLVLVLISFIFICIGLFITNFTRTQSTAILSSLLISVPLIFLSGMILPTSFMPSFVRAFSEVLPLTVAMSLITGILVRGTPLIYLLPEILLLLVPALAIIAFTLIWPKIREK